MVKKQRYASEPIYDTYWRYGKDLEPLGYAAIQLLRAQNETSEAAMNELEWLREQYAHHERLIEQLQTTINDATPILYTVLGYDDHAYPTLPALAELAAKKINELKLWLEQTRKDLAIANKPQSFRVYS